MSKKTDWQFVDFVDLVTDLEINNHEFKWNARPIAFFYEKFTGEIKFFNKSHVEKLGTEVYEKLLNKKK